MHGRQRVGPMLNCSFFPPRARLTGGPRSVCRLAVVLLLAANTVLAFGQFGQRIRRPALTSSTRVMLIARVESLSVVANAGTVAESVAAGEPASLQPISVTTSWAVPANFTTFRLSEYFGRPQAIPAASQANGLGSAEPQERLAVADENELVVDSGETNQAKSRTDELDADAYPGGIDTLGGDEEGGLLSILVQAL